MVCCLLLCCCVVCCAMRRSLALLRTGARSRSTTTSAPAFLTFMPLVHPPLPHFPLFARLTSGCVVLCLPTRLRMTVALSLSSRLSLAWLMFVGAVVQALPRLRLSRVCPAMSTMALYPGVIYTHPEVATVGKQRSLFVDYPYRDIRVHSFACCICPAGLSEDQLKESGVQYKVTKFPLQANRLAPFRPIIDCFPNPLSPVPRSHHSVSFLCSSLAARAPTMMQKAL